MEISLEIKNAIKICVNELCVIEWMTNDEIEDLEINLTDIIKQLQDYRMEQNHE